MHPSPLRQIAVIHAANHHCGWCSLAVLTSILISLPSKGFWKCKIWFSYHSVAPCRSTAHQRMTGIKKMLPTQFCHKQDACEQGCNEFSLLPIDWVYHQSVGPSVGKSLMSAFLRTDTHIYTHTQDTLNCSKIKVAHKKWNTHTQQQPLNTLCWNAVAHIKMQHEKHVPRHENWSSTPICLPVHVDTFATQVSAIDESMYVRCMHTCRQSF